MGQIEHLEESQTLEKNQKLNTLGKGERTFDIESVQTVVSRCSNCVLYSSKYSSMGGGRAGNIGTPGENTSAFVNDPFRIP